MKTGLAALVVWLAVAAPPAAAVQSQEPGAQIQQRLEAIKERLALTPDQIERVRPVLAEEAKKLRALRDKYASGEGQSRRSRRSMARELRDIRSDADEQLKRILSRQQMDELKDIREEWRQELRGRVR